MLDLFEREIPKLFSVKVTTRAKYDRIKREIKDSGTVYRVYVTAPPEDGKANKAVIALIAKELGVSKSKIMIMRGLASRDKLISIST